MKRSYKIAIIIVVQIIFLSLMVGFKYYTLSFGTPVLLKTAPIDPRDIFRGEYVRLNYEITLVKSQNLDLEYNQDVFVVLEKGDPYWNAVAISVDKPGLAANQVMIKGKALDYVGRSQGYRLNYGIDTYYVEEGKGKEIERLRNIDVLVRVDRFGNAVIEELVSK